MRRPACPKKLRDLILGLDCSIWRAGFPRSLRQRNPAPPRQFRLLLAISPGIWLLIFVRLIHQDKRIEHHRLPTGFEICDKRLKLQHPPVCPHIPGDHYQMVLPWHLHDLTPTRARA